MKDNLDIPSLAKEITRLPLNKQKKLLSDIQQSPNYRQQLVHFFKEEIDKIEKQHVDEIDEDNNVPYVLLYVLAYLEETEAFSQFTRLIDLEEEKVEQVFGSFFPSEQAEYVFPYLTSNWLTLKPLIENSEINLYWRLAALQSLLYLVIKDKVTRKEISQYLKQLLQTQIDQEQPDNEFITFLITICCEFYPHDMMNEIQEAFAREIVDLSIIRIDHVLEDLKKGEAFAVAELKESFKAGYPLDMIRFDDSTEEDNFIHVVHVKEYIENLENKLERKNQHSTSPYLSSNSIGRNDPCPCGSGKKYKKCCLCLKTDHKILKEDNPSETIKLSSTITFEPLEDDLLDNFVTPSELEEINRFREVEFNQHDPEEALQLLFRFKEKYPHIPCFYNWIYTVYTYNRQPKMALNILEETRSKFPDYLFGLVEHAHYFLRRGEYEKVAELLNHKFILNLLYPEREVFHISEVRAFHNLMVRYFLAIKNVPQAKMYYDVLAQLIPDEDIVQILNLEIQKAERLLQMKS